jgi:cytoskeletal protein CcmA (bactofilin family)
MLPSHSFDPGTPAERRPPAVPGPVVSRDPRVEEGDGQQIPVLGKTLLFRGELSAEEDVILQGRVEGSIRHARNLIIGTDGSVLGDVYASHLTVEGLVEGDLHCSEAVIVRATAQVRGNIFAPRVGIMEGATFNGRVEMDPTAAAKGAGGPSRAPTRQAAAAARPPQGGASPGASRSAPSQSAASPPAGSAVGATLAGAAVEQLLGSPGVLKK